MSQLLIDSAHYLPVSDLSEDEEREVEHSRQSCLLYTREKKLEGLEIDMLEGNVCSDSESDNPDEWIDVDLRTEAGKKLLQKERRRIKQKAKCQTAKRVAEEKFLSVLDVFLETTLTLEKKLKILFNLKE